MRLTSQGRGIVVSHTSLRIYALTGSGKPRWNGQLQLEDGEPETWICGSEFHWVTVEQLRATTVAHIVKVRH